MGKYPLPAAQTMTDAAYIDRAAEWADWLTRTESRGPGDRENAWGRLERRYGIPPRAFWSLRYRRPKTLIVSIYFRLQAAYQAECQRQMRKLQHELAITKATAGADSAAVRAATALVGEDGE